MHINTKQIRELDDQAIDSVIGGALSDALGAISAGLGIMAAGAAMELGSGGLATPLAIGVIAAGVAVVHAGVAGAALGG